MEAFEKGESCSGVYLIKPDNLPPFEVSVYIQVLIQKFNHTMVSNVYVQCTFEVPTLQGGNNVSIHKR